MFKFKLLASVMILVFCSTSSWVLHPFSQAYAAGERTRFSLVQSWGDNSHGQLGIGISSRTSLEPTQAINLTDVKKIALGGLHSLALKGNGTVWTWGDNYCGQLGIGRTSSYPTPLPIQVMNLTDVKKIAVGWSYYLALSHNLALKEDGTVWAWGENSRGQLGTGSAGYSSPAPVQVSHLTHVKNIAAGGQHSLALKQDGTVWAWGCNEDGQLGTGSIARDPLPVMNLTNVKQIVASDTSSLALKEDGTVWAWGNNFYGQLGIGTIGENSSIPVQVANLTGIKKIATGHNFSLALKRDGTVWAWGDNSSGQLGIGIIAGNRSIPVQVNSLSHSGVRKIAASATHGIALKEDGTVWTWGSNNIGQLGIGIKGGNRSLPVQIMNLTHVRKIVAGRYHSLALQSYGTPHNATLNGRHRYIPSQRNEAHRFFTEQERLQHQREQQSAQQ